MFALFNPRNNSIHVLTTIIKTENYDGGIALRSLKFALLGLSSILLLAAACLLISGGILVWVHEGLADDEGYVNIGTQEIEKDSYAVITDPFDIDETALIPLNWFGLDAVRIKTQGNDPSKSMFVGIAAESDVNSYLNDVEYDRITHVTETLSIQSTEYSNHPGSSEPSAPIEQVFWKASQHGNGTLLIEWEPKPSTHMLVLINEDGSAGLNLNMTQYMHISIVVVAAGIIFLVAGTLALVMGIAIIYFAIFRKLQAS